MKLLPALEAGTCPLPALAACRDHLDNSLQCVGSISKCDEVTVATRRFYETNKWKEIMKIQRPTNSVYIKEKEVLQRRTSHRQSNILKYLIPAKLKFIPLAISNTSLNRNPIPPLSIPVSRLDMSVLPPPLIKESVLIKTIDLSSSIKASSSSSPTLVSDKIDHVVDTQLPVVVPLPVSNLQSESPFLLNKNDLSWVLLIIGFGIGAVNANQKSMLLKKQIEIKNIKKTLRMTTITIVTCSLITMVRECVTRQEYFDKENSLNAIMSVTGAIVSSKATTIKISRKKTVINAIRAATLIIITIEPVRLRYHYCIAIHAALVVVTIQSTETLQDQMTELLDICKEIDMPIDLKQPIVKKRRRTRQRTMTFSDSIQKKRKKKITQGLQVKISSKKSKLLPEPPFNMDDDIRCYYNNQYLANRIQSNNHIIIIGIESYPYPSMELQFATATLSNLLSKILISGSTFDYLSATPSAASIWLYPTKDNILHLLWEIMMHKNNSNNDLLIIIMGRGITDTGGIVDADGVEFSIDELYLLLAQGKQRHLLDNCTLVCDLLGCDASDFGYSVCHRITDDNYSSPDDFINSIVPYTRKTCGALIWTFGTAMASMYRSALLGECCYRSFYDFHSDVVERLFREGVVLSNLITKDDHVGCTEPMKIFSLPDGDGLTEVSDANQSKTTIQWYVLGIILKKQVLQTPISLRSVMFKVINKMKESFTTTNINDLLMSDTPDLCSQKGGLYIRSVRNDPTINLKYCVVEFQADSHTLDALLRAIHFGATSCVFDPLFIEKGVHASTDHYAAQLIQARWISKRTRQRAEPQSKLLLHWLTTRRAEEVDERICWNQVLHLKLMSLTNYIQLTEENERKKEQKWQFMIFLKFFPERRTHLKEVESLQRDRFEHYERVGELVLSEHQVRISLTHVETIECRGIRWKSKIEVQESFRRYRIESSEFSHRLSLRSQSRVVNPECPLCKDLPLKPLSPIDSPDTAKCNPDSDSDSESGALIGEEFI